MPKSDTNVEFVTELMTSSKHGALVEVFVLEALRSYADSVAASKFEEYPSMGLISPQVWIDCGKDVKQMLDKRYKGV